VNGCAGACCCGHVWICLVHRGMRCFLAAVVAQRSAVAAVALLCRPRLPTVVAAVGAVGAIVLVSAAFKASDASSVVRAALTQPPVSRQQFAGDPISFFLPLSLSS